MEQTPPHSAENDARARIAEAAALTGSPWLDYMARHGEPSMTPDAWADAVIRADREIALYGDRPIPPDEPYLCEPCRDGQHWRCSEPGTCQCTEPVDAPIPPGSGTGEA